MKKLHVFLLSTALLLGLVLPSYAVEIPDPDRTASLTLVMESQEEPLTSGRLTIYRVGDFDRTDPGYRFVPVPELQDSGVSLDDPDDTGLPQTLVNLTSQYSLEPVTVSVQNGKAVFSQLVPGLFLVTQAEADACDGFAPIRPFLLSLPSWDGTAYVYDLTAKPKLSPETKPTEPTETEPPKPTEPSLPQTGQLKWPIPVMAVSGVACIAAGVYLCFRKRERNGE